MGAKTVAVTADREETVEVIVDIEEVAVAMELEQMTATTTLKKIHVMEKAAVKAIPMARGTIVMEEMTAMAKIVALIQINAKEILKVAQEVQKVKKMDCSRIPYYKLSLLP